MPEKQLSIGYSAIAQSQLTEMKDRALSNPSGADATVYNGIKRIIEHFWTPALFSQREAWLRKPLANVGRSKWGRFRIFFIASSQQQRIVVLFIGYRKEGDKKDAYEEFSRLLKRGSFDDIFQALGVGKPAL